MSDSNYPLNNMTNRSKYLENRFKFNKKIVNVRKNNQYGTMPLPFIWVDRGGSKETQ